MKFIDIGVSDLIANSELLEEIYLIVLKDYYNVDKYSFNIESFIKTLLANRDKRIIYLVDKEIVGYLEYEDLGEGKVYLSSVTIKKEYRGNGYAKALMNNALNKLNQFNNFIIHVNKDKLWLKDFYLSLGFSLTAESDEFIMNYCR